MSFLRRRRFNKKLLFILPIVVVVVFVVAQVYLSLDNSGSLIMYEVTPVPNEYSDYPDIELLVGKDINYIQSKFPDGDTTRSYTTWGANYEGYIYENDLYILQIDYKDKAIVDLVSLAVKKLDNCIMNSSVLDRFKEVAAYGHLNTKRITTATNPGVANGIASVYDYEEDMVVSVTCYKTTGIESYYSVLYYNYPEY